MTKASSWLAGGLLLLCGLSGALYVVSEWQGNDRWDGILEALIALAPILAALLVSLLVYAVLGVGLLRRRPAGTWRGAFAGALLVGTALLWLVPLLAAANYQLLADYLSRPLTLPILWANFAAPVAFWPLFWLGNGLGAWLGYAASRGRPEQVS